MPPLILWLCIAAAVLLFWAVGAYNRLVRLRAGVRKAFAALDEQLVRQIVWVQGCLPESLRDGGAQTAPIELQDETTAAWARLLAASDQFAAALAHARADVADVPTMAAVVLAHESLRNALTHALATAIPPDAVPSADRLQTRWLRLLHQSLPLRAAFNDAAQTYNHAITQFPASLLARTAHLRPAGTATRLAEPR
jgi:LemA protein